MPLAVISRPITTRCSGPPTSRRASIMAGATAAPSTAGSASSVANLAASGRR